MERRTENEDLRTERRSPRAHVWIDGSSLGRAQTGYFNLLAELIRRLAADDMACAVHVSTSRHGQAALHERLAAEASRIRFHPIGWRAIHWSQVHTMIAGWHGQLLLTITAVALIALAIAGGGVAALIAAAMILGAQALVLIDELAAQYAEAAGHGRARYFARLIRFLWRRVPAPRGRARTPDTIEVLFWRGRFRWRDSHRVAIVQDMTTRIVPELHTPGNVREFDEYLDYVQRHAHSIATISEHSRRDILDHLAVPPDAVSVIPMPVHPQYVSPQFSRAILRIHRLTPPYVLSVATIEPRKNLRRVVRALELLQEEDGAREHCLVLVGAQGWDEGFADFLEASDVRARVTLLGYVPLEHLPSLYHFAAAVITASVYEGFGLPVMEAMCSSAVTLASGSSSLPEVLGPDGIYFDPLDSRDIAAALLRALTLSPADAAGYRQQCRRRAETHLARLATEPILPGLPPLAEAVRRDGARQANTHKTRVGED